MHPFFKKKFVVEKFPEVDTNVLEDAIIELMKDESKKEKQDENDLHPIANRKRLQRLYQNTSDDSQSQEVQFRFILNEYLNSPTSENLIFPSKILGKVFIRTNSCLMSSGSCERMFSITKHILTATRTQLEDKKFHKIVTLKTNLMQTRKKKTKRANNQNNNEEDEQEETFNISYFNISDEEDENADENEEENEI